MLTLITAWLSARLGDLGGKFALFGSVVFALFGAYEWAKRQGSKALEAKDAQAAARGLQNALQAENAFRSEGSELALQKGEF